MNEISIKWIFFFLVWPLSDKCYGFFPPSFRLLCPGKYLQTSKTWLSSKNILEQNEAIVSCKKEI